MPDLYPYQEIGARWLADHPRGLLADEMGLGKSAQAIRAADLVGARRVLVICPAAARTNWHREFDRFSLTRPHVDVISYERAAKGWDDPFDTLICDEAHYIKNPRSKRTKAVYAKRGGLMHRAERVWLLTGTPMPNDPREVWPMLHYMFGCEMNEWRFTRRFCSGYENAFGGFVVTGGKNMSALKKMIDPHMLRRKAEDELDLPPLRFCSSALDAKTTGDLKALEDEIGPDILAMLESGDDGALARLKAKAPHVAQLRRLTGLVKAPAIADRVASALSEELKAVGIFCLHTDVISYMKERLKSFGVVTVDGSNSSRAQAAVDAFQSGAARVFIGQIKSAGTALTLTAGRHVVFAETAWTPADNLQAAKRFHRIGQKGSVMVDMPYLPGSIDERVTEVCRRKTATAAGVFG